MRLQFSFWDGRTQAKIVTFTRTDDSRKIGSNFRVRGRDEITDKSEACRSIELLFSTRSHSPRVRVGSTTRSLLEKPAAELRPDEEPYRLPVSKLTGLLRSARLLYIR